MSMITSKYKIVVFSGSGATCRQLCCRGWIFCVLILFITGLVASNLYFYKGWSGNRHAERELAGLSKRNEEQRTQLVSFSGKIQRLANEIEQMQELNTKIRVMANLDQGPHSANIINRGGPHPKKIKNDFLPHYRSERLVRKMHDFIDHLNTEAKLEEIKQQEIISFMLEKKDLLARTPSIWPTKGWLTSKFGYRRSPFTGRREFHKGLDISAPTGTPIHATAGGRVVQIRKDHGYGKNILVDHGNGIVTRYAHLHKYAVKKGARVKRGELIAYVGNTGRSTGPHLHYEVRLNGVPVNPFRYIVE
ncbi:M23 family metallopeptidase [Desulfoplanes sp.]